VLELVVEFLVFELELVFDLFTFLEQKLRVGLFGEYIWRWDDGRFEDRETWGRKLAGECKSGDGIAVASFAEKELRGFDIDFFFFGVFIQI
jgi:hypothetical protein